MVISVVVSTAVSTAAVISMLAGAAAARMTYAEVVQSRRESSRARAAQARAFGAALGETYAEHAAFTATLAAQLDARSREMTERDDMVRIANRRADKAHARADGAQARADEAQARVDRESDRADRESVRADEAQGRLSGLLDEVLRPQVTPLRTAQITKPDDLPAVVDLLAWEERVNASVSRVPRQQA